MELAGITPPSMAWDATNLPEQWEKFMRHTELMFSGPLKAKTEEEKVSYLLLWVGDKGRDIRHTWKDIPNGDEKKLKTFYDRFKKHVRPTLNPIFARYQFNNEVQGTETIDSFVTRLRLRAQDCDFGANSDEMIRDRIVFGTNSPKIREKLINVGKDLTLPQAIQISQNYEYAQIQMKQMASNQNNDVHVVRKKNNGRSRRGTTISKGNKPTGATGYAPQTGPQTGPQPGRQTGSKTKPGQDNKCRNCGYDVHKTIEQCPAKGQTCRKCGKMNHYQRVCRSKTVHDVENEQCEEENSDFYVDTVNRSFSHYDQAFATLHVGPKKIPIRFKIDTGSQVNILPLTKFHELNIQHPLAPPDSQLSSYTGDPLNVKGTLRLSCSHKDKHMDILFYIVETSKTPLLSLKTSLDLNLIQLIYSVDSPACQNADMHDAFTKEKVLQEFQDLFKGVGLLSGDVELHLKPDAIPVVNPPRRIPIALRDRFKAELSRMEKQNIIAPVHSPTDWVNSFVIVEKPKTQSLRICLDPKALNDAIRRPHYPMRTFDEVVSQLSEAAYFSVLDATSGYWSLKLEENSSYLTTFNTPFGRYRYLRVPFGLNCSQDVFQRKMDETFVGLSGVTGIVDDILIYGKTRAEHDRNLRNALSRARERGLRLNADKCKIGLTEVRYFGHILTNKGLKIDDQKLSAIRQMEAPKDKAELETILGMLTYLTRFAPNLATLTAPLRDLQKAEFLWDACHDRTFQKIKDVLTDSPVLAYFNPDLDVTLQVDASKYGIGATLLQQGRPISYASKTLTQTEVGYAQIEKEMLAILFGCKKYHQYIYGRHVVVESDAKPISSIAKKPLSAAPLRLQRILLQLQRYDLEIRHVSGRDLPVADTLSRKFMPDTYPELSEGLDLHVHTVMSTISVSDRKLDEVRQATRNDNQMQILKQTILDGWPETRKMCQTSVVEFWNHRDELSVAEDIIFRGQKIVIPTALRHEMVQKVHDSHMGVEKSLQRAKDIMFWPRMTSDITDYVLSCSICLQYRQSNAKEPLVSHEVPDRPWQVAGTDVFTFDNKDYLVTVDYFSHFFEVDLLPNTTSTTIIRKFKAIFARHGVVDKLVCDNARYYCSGEMTDFAKEWNFEIIHSSPRYPRSNGMSEKYVSIVKRIFQKAKDSKRDPYLAILEYRTTPLESCHLSPSQLSMSRRLKTILPCSNEQLKPQRINLADVRQKMSENRQKQKKFHDRSAIPLPKLQKGDKVRVQLFDKHWKPAVITNVHGDRSYMLQTNDGGLYRRNRKFIHKSKDQTRNDTEYLAIQNSHTQENSETSNIPTRETEHQKPWDYAQSCKQNTENMNFPDIKSPAKPQSDPYITKSGRQVIPNKFLNDPMWQK